MRDDPEIAFEWLSGSPDPSVNDDQFSARWTRTVNFEEGEYQFNIYRDDGARLLLTMSKYGASGKKAAGAGVPMKSNIK